MRDLYSPKLSIKHAIGAITDINLKRCILHQGRTYMQCEVICSYTLKCSIWKVLCMVEICEFKSDKQIIVSKHSHKDTKNMRALAKRLKEDGYILP